MREIKFRAWDKIYKKIFPVSFIDWDGDTVMIKGIPRENNDVVDFEYRSFDQVELMQFTGLHDNTKWEQLTKEEQDKWLSSGKTEDEWNGVEIYEGDIIYLNPSIAVPRIVEWNEVSCAYDLVIKDRVTFHLGQWLYEEYSSLKVMGNVRENPELLEQGEK